MANINVKQKVDYNQIAAHNWVLPAQTKASITTPVDGQVVFEGGIAYAYDNAQGKWTVLGADGMRIKGTLGTDASHPEWLANLPEEPSLGDAYYVGQAGSYGPTGSTQHGDVGDLFICIDEKTSTVAAKWTLVPSGNGRFAGTITGDGTATSFTLAHPLNTKELVVNVYDASDHMVVVGVTVSTTNVVLDFAVAPATTDTYTVIVIAG